MPIVVLPNNPDSLTISKDVTVGQNLWTLNPTANQGAMKITSAGGVNYIQSGLTTTSNSAAPLKFTTINVGGVHMTLDINGNLGIGTENPAYKLDVNGNFRVFNNIQTIQSSLLTNSNQIQFNSSNGQIYTIQQIDNASQNYFRLGRNGYGDIVIDKNGNVGIGNASPSYNLHVAGGGTSTVYTAIDATSGTGQASLTIKAGNGSTNRASRIDMYSINYTLPTWTIINDYNQNGTNELRFVNNTGASNTLTLLQNGNVGINNATPSYLLDVNGITRTQWLGVGPYSGTPAFQGGSYAMVIQPPSGTNPLAINAVNDTYYIISFINSAGTYRGGIIGVNSTTVAYNTTSDQRKKANIKDMPSMIEKIKNLKPKTFEWIEDGAKDDGFIAQEVHKVFPKFRAGVQAYCNLCNYTYNDIYDGKTCSCCDTENPVDKDGKPYYYGLDYAKFTPYLTKGLQETIINVERMEEEMNTLKTENIELKKTINNLLQRLNNAGI